MNGEEMERQIGELKGLVSGLSGSLHTALERVTRLEVMREADSRRIDMMSAQLGTIDDKLDKVLFRLSASDGEKRQSESSRNIRIAAVSAVGGGAVGWLLQHVGLR